LSGKYLAARLLTKTYSFGFLETVLTWVTQQENFRLQGSGDIKEIVWNFNLDLAAGEYVEMQLAADDTNVTLEAVAPATPHPGVTSAVVTINFISALPEVRPTPP
jgi:hypothetical protein